MALQTTKASFVTVALLSWLLVGADDPRGPKVVYELQPADGAVTFLAIGKPSFLKINGKGDRANGKLEIIRTKKSVSASGTFTFNLDSLDTGIKKRNQHMKEKYLEVKTYPTSTFVLEPIRVPSEFFNRKYNDKIPFKGKLSLHGVEKPISGTAELTKDEKSLKTRAAFRINIKDFSIAIPEFAGITVTEMVDVIVEFTGALNDH